MGRRRVAQDTDVPSPEAEQPVPESQKEVDEMPQWFKCPVPPHRHQGQE